MCLSQEKKIEREVKGRRTGGGGGGGGEGRGNDYQMETYYCAAAVAATYF